jgi:aminoglycoside phosphotransferase (APT) family kinase protein
VVRVEDALAEALPGLRPRSLQTIDTGWDSVAFDVDGEWILRVARDERVARLYHTEGRILRELELPLPTPSPVRVGEGWILTRRIPGHPYDGRVDAAPLGRFFAALHAFPVEQARALGVPSHDRGWRERYDAFARGLLGRARSLLGDDADRAEAMLAGYLDDPANFTFAPRLIHADLGPEHILASGDELTGIIDWSDARIGDPALDFAWALNRTPPEFAAAVLAAYDTDDASLPERALFFHRLGPWYELHYGIHFHKPEYVESGLAGVRSRLPPALG